MIEGLSTPVDPEKVEYLLERVGYWRKANAIHRWFVEHAQDGNDNCGVYTVSRHQLTDLLTAVHRVLNASELVEDEISSGYRHRDGTTGPIVVHDKVIKDPSVAKQELPTQDGFFFGSTGYDQGYIEDLLDTRQILSDALADVDAEEFEYSSIW